MNIPEEEQDAANANILLAKSKLINLGLADSSKFGVWNLTEKGRKEKISEKLIQEKWRPAGAGKGGDKLKSFQLAGMTYLSTRHFPIELKNRLHQIGQTQLNQAYR